jgi:transmembrane sensor
MKPSKPADPLTQEAIDWLIRIADAPDDGGLRAAADTWRHLTPGHAEAWEKAERAWSWLADPVVDPAIAVRPMETRRGSGRRWLVGVASALAAGLLMLFLPSLVTNLGADFATTTAELRRIVLEDGTVVELAPQSALDVRFTADRRSVALLSGEAFFSVAHSSERPFEVLAGELSVVVTGTAFDVRLQGNAVSVAVEHGSVEARSSFASLPTSVRLQAGDQLTLDRRSGGALRGRLVPQDVGSWREHRLFVDNATVAEVIDTLRRYRSGWIVLTDDSLAQQKVAGLYDLRDPDQALRILVGPFGGRVREVTPMLRIISGP